MAGSLSALDRAGARAQGTLARAVLRLPRPALRALAGRPVIRDGQQLELEAQALLRLMAATPAPELSQLTPEQGRRRVARDTMSVEGVRPEPVSVESLSIAGTEEPLPARLYIPGRGERGGGLLVYYHGGGFVVCDLNTHDHLCRTLALAAGVRVLAVNYRLAPEHRFPAATRDAWAAFAFAVARATELGVDPRRVAVGGDSAGGNLAAGVAQRAAHDGGPAPAFQMLLYPWLDLSRERASFRLFGEGFYLTGEDLRWYASHYLDQPGQATDPLCSPLLAETLSGVAPAYIATAGFDPLRDEGEEYAERLRAAGVEVALQRHAGLFHGFANALGPGRAGREAVLQAAGALRLGLAEPVAAPARR